VEGARKVGGHHSYVNYAYGGESLEDLYGVENLERLSKLKRAYDPGNRFGFYAPIMPKAKEGGRSNRDEL